MNENEYPTEDELKKITEWPYPDFDGLMKFVESLWMYAEEGYWKREGQRYSISTGGWSGNEEIIGAMQQNIMFWTMCWYQSQRGGHYVFHIR